MNRIAYMRAKYVWKPQQLELVRDSSRQAPRTQLREVQAPPQSDWDDDPIGELDDDTLILLQAMAELDEEAGAQARAWNPALHKRWPKGHPNAGKFRPMIDLLKMAIQNHNGQGHPFDHFNREQLRKAAKARGITLKRGEDRDSIAAKLLADLKQPAHIPAPPAQAAKAAKAAAKKAPKPGTPTGQRTSVNHKAIATAKDVVNNPKSHSNTARLDAYDDLTKADFDSLDAQTRNDIIADLSGIHLLSTGFTGQVAFGLINRFTPAGTPSGAMPNPPVLPPTAAKAAKKGASKAGTPGLLKKAKDPGLSGDGWFYPPGGGKAVWGKYGAAGLLLHHRGSDGVDRYLMVQRGPAISDPGKWQFPGGAIDSKETPFEGATREVLEELGFKDADLAPGLVHGTHEVSVAGGWKYTSIAASVPTQLKPDLSTHHARAETSDAKWMTIDEIRKLDSDGKLLAPLAGGKLEANVVSLFPPSTGARARKPKTPPLPTHKPSTGKNLIRDKAAQDKLRADIAAVRKNYRGKTADERLAAIGAMQGYDATPTVASKAEMDRLLATGDYIEVWRGVSGKAGKPAAAINEDMRSGPAFFGLGVFGNGYYLATDKKIAERYADGSKNSLLRILIPKTAKTDKHEKIVDKARAATSSTTYYHQGRQNMGGGTLHDEGRYAAAAGLDGIEISKHDYARGGGYGQYATGPVYNWVNRSVLIIEEAQ